MLQRMVDFGAATGAAVSIGAAHVLTFQNDVTPIPTDPGELIRWAIKESALLVVVLIVLFFYRRDFKNKGKTDATLVRDSIQVNTELKGQVSRLARAIEVMNMRADRRHDDPPLSHFRDPEDGEGRRG